MPAATGPDILILVILLWHQLAALVAAVEGLYAFGVMLQFQD